MQYNPNERLAGNDSINAVIHEILSKSSEPSRSRMLRKIRQDRDTLAQQRTDQADANARHTFREFLVGYKFNSMGFCLEYNKKISGQTPDWYDEKNRLLVEVFTCERGGRSDPVQRVAGTIDEKVTKYMHIVKRDALRFVAAIHGDFACGFDRDDCERAVSQNRLFEQYSELTGVVFYAETNVVPVDPRDLSMGVRQEYQFVYLSNRSAQHRLDLEYDLDGMP
jgi:hypothetical protein